MANRYFFKITSICLLLLSASFFYQVQAQNSALAFDGIDDRVTIRRHPAYNIGTGDFTLEAIINVKVSSSLRPAMPVFSTRTTPSDGLVVYAFSSGMSLQMKGLTNYVYYANQTYDYYDGQCHHVAVTRSGTSLKFYLDGIFQSALTSEIKNINGHGNMYLGCDSLESNTLDGSFSEARFWSVERTATQIYTYKNSNVPSTETGLIGLWKFAEASGQTIIDSSPTANNGVLGITSSVENEDPTRSAACGFAPVTTVLFESSEENKNITAAPNPFEVQTKITLQRAAADYHVELYNTAGLLVYRKAIRNNSEFVLGEELQAGIYTVKVISKEGVQTSRIEKK